MLNVSEGSLSDGYGGGTRNAIYTYIYIYTTYLQDGSGRPSMYYGPMSQPPQKGRVVFWRCAVEDMAVRLR